ncbi:hypothetical protein ACFLUF_03570 [Chloroflexota bacterium]
MALDFTLSKYRELCQSVLKSQYTVLTVAAYLTSEKLPEKCIILRHDIDRKPFNALRMAEVENKNGIRSTYYFRINNTVFLPDLIKEIAAMGHEIGYHYEALDKAKGDYQRAIRIFEQDLVKLRKVADVKTICMHGNPLTKWDNRDLWKKYDFKNFGLVGEAYLSFHDIAYFSDTGRNWGGKHSVKDWMPPASQGKNVKDIDAKSTDDIIEVVKKETFESIYLLAHPERWSNSLIAWITDWLVDIGVNMVKRMLGLLKRTAILKK